METELYGLVLSGGRSTRMGLDKSIIGYHGIPQREYLYQMLTKLCSKTFISIREDQQEEIPAGIQVIIDNDKYKGPYNGLLSAHESYPRTAWLVLACDLPLMDSTALEQLVKERNPKAAATAFATRLSPLPEPLCAIWEPSGLQESIKFLERGIATCPRKFLIASDVKLVFPTNENVLLNANSKEDFEEAIAKLKGL